MHARFFRLVLAGSAWLTALIAAAPTLGVERFPPAMRNDLGLSYTPPCRLCHIQGTTGSGSVATPFGRSMLAHGLTTSQSTLEPALSALRADHTDSDGDGISDIDELTANTDPNTPVDAPLVSGDPQYGCSVPARRGDRSGAVAALAAALAMSLRRKRPTGRQ